VRILHTADWHVGRSLRGRSRADEHRAVLAEIASLVESEKVDLAIVAGDLFDVAAPSAEAEEIVYAALLGLVDAGAEVVLIAGNHDHPHRLDAIRPLFERTGLIHAVAEPRAPDAGGVLRLEPARAGGERALVAALPFLSQKRSISAHDLMQLEAAERTQSYAARCRGILDALCKPFGSDTVNVLTSHLMVTGAAPGGGERMVHLQEDYWVPAAFFAHPALHYVALGHLHRQQRMASQIPVWYSGSVLQLDFGEEQNECGVLVVEATPGKPAEVRALPLAAGRSLRTLSGTLEQLAAEAGAVGEEYLRVRVAERPRVGLGDEVRDLFANAVDVRVLDPSAPEEPAEDTVDRLRVEPRQIFSEYLEDQGLEDQRLLVLFDQLLEAEHEA
jgi:exonuclease SbcD